MLCDALLLHCLLVGIEATVLATLLGNLIIGLIDLLLMGKNPSTAMRWLEQLQFYADVGLTSLPSDPHLRVEESMGR